jgi:WD40 repeat protein
VSPDGTMHPEDDAWVVKVHASENGGLLLGGGVVLDDRRVLTCAHVVGVWDEAGGGWAEPEPGIWVSFPNAETSDSERRFPVEWVALPSGELVRDVAVLHLTVPPPASVPAAPLLCLRSGDLVGKRWRALGFGDAIGEVVEGVVGATLAHGWIRLDRDQQSQYPVTRGFSGSGLWSPQYRAVVAVVTHGHGETGGGRAVTLHQGAQWLPDEGITALSGRPPPARTGNRVRAAWNWSLSDDLEGARHWRTSGRGVSVASEHGFRFRGRAAALRAVRDWLDREALGGRVLVVTGAPGTGKSAVLGRIVTTADPAEVGQLPASDDGVRAKTGSVGCAVYAKGKTALEIAVEIARAARAVQPVQRLDDFKPALRQALSENQGRRFNVIIDALDEAASPVQARAAVEKVILPLAGICAQAGGSVVVGSRRTDGNGQDLLGAFGAAAQLVDLDDEEFFDKQDLAAYALVTLQLAWSMRQENPFDDDETADRAAKRIAGLSGQNFLVAQLIARMLAVSGGTAVDPASAPSSVTVDDAMREFLGRIPPVLVGTGPDAAVLSAGTLLTPLAFAEAPGLPAGLWQAALRALGAGDVPEAALTRFARSSSAKFLVESTGTDRQGATFLLSHQALNDTLLRARARTASRAEDEAALTRGFLQAGQDAGWQHASRYLLRSLPAHAARAGLVDALLADDEYFLYSDLRRVLQVTDRAESAAARDRARLLRLTPQAVTATPSERVGLFNVTETLEHISRSYGDRAWPSPYTSLWSSARLRTEELTLEGHWGSVSSLCPMTVQSRSLVASGGHDGTVRIWDPATGELVRTIEGRCVRGDVNWVNAMCLVTVGVRSLLACGSADGTVRIWDPATGELVRTLDCHRHVMAVCPVTVRRRELLASGGHDGRVRIWDSATGELVRSIDGHRIWDNAVCSVTVQGRSLLACGCAGMTVRILDPATGELVRTLDGRGHAVKAVCSVTVQSRDLLASGGDDGTVRLWDPAIGELVRTLEGHQDKALSLCQVTIDGRTLLAVGGHDMTARLWNPATGELVRTFEGRSWGTIGNEVHAVCPVTVHGRQLLASASSDGAIRIWDTAIGESARALGNRDRMILSVGTVIVQDRTLLASPTKEDGTFRIFDPVNGEPIRAFEGHQSQVTSVCPVTVHGRQLLASGSNDETVRLWDPAAGELIRTLKGHNYYVSEICPVTVHGRQLLASGSADKTVLIWDPSTGKLMHRLIGNQSWVNAVCPVIVRGRELVASGGSDRTVRIWDPATGALVYTMKGHLYAVTTVCPVTVHGRQLLASGGDHTVRVWDPAAGTPFITIPVRDTVHHLTAVASMLAIGQDDGLLVVELNTAPARG